MIPLISNGLALATIATHGFLLIVIILAIYQTATRHLLPVSQLISKATHPLIFVATTTALLGSLFFSDIAKLPPCELCWWQRIFMYPQAIISFIGLMRSESVILRPYLIILSSLGGLISLYHNLLLWFPDQSAAVQCGIKGGVSCIDGYQTYFGYVTIPLMALTVFAFVLIMLILYPPPLGSTQSSAGSSRMRASRPN